MSGKRFELLDVPDHFDRCQTDREIDWNLCFLCQGVDQTALVCPANVTRADASQGYLAVIENLRRFEEIGQLPSSLKRRFQNPNLLDNFVQYQAKFHKSCRNRYDNYHYNRVCRKRRVDESSQEQSSTVTLKTRSQYTADNFQPTCILCDEHDSDKNLHHARTLGLDKRIRDAAILLSDDKLLARLSEGDLVAIEARYHKNCLTILGNRVRAIKSSKPAADVEYEIIYGVVLAEIVSYIQECCCVEETIPVFKLSALKTLFCKRLVEYGASEEYKSKIHSTRLKEKIIELLPELSEHKKGREILLTLKEETGSAIFDSCSFSGEDDGRCLARAAKIIRKQMFADDKEEPKHEASVPASLYSLVRMILGVSVIGGEPCELSNSRAATSISQLIRFNTIRKEKKHNDIVEKIRHMKADETPFPLYIGLMIHSKTRKKGLVVNLAKHGISVPYNRVQNFELAITKQLCKIYRENGVVCPPSIQNGMFTSAAIDNIDHNPSSSTALSAFHGTSISIFQHPKIMRGQTQLQLENDIEKSSVPLELPSYYTEICPTKSKIPEYPLQRTNTEDYSNNAQKLLEDNGWLQNLHCWESSEVEIPLFERVSWSAYNAKKLERNEALPTTLSTLLPLLKESITSTATVAHTMKIVKLILQHVNPGQIPVMTADQPVYAISKQVQWLYPELYGEGKLLMMMGALHIEMCLLSTIGDWLDGSGWVELLVKSNISTPGRIESMIQGKQVKRCRYVHQVSCAALYLKLGDVYKCSGSSLTLQDWIESKRAKSPQFHYWATVIELEALLLKLVQSLRESNFFMFVQTLEEIVPWVFALDHTNYARWLPIFIQDLKMLSSRHPSIHKEFMEGNFTVRKTRKAFSTIAEDQAHEQNNKIIKIDGGAIGILDNETALLKWMVGGPEIARLVNEFKNYDEESEDEDKTPKEELPHHEDSNSFEKRFRKDVASLEATLSEIGNPFDEGDILFQIMTKNVMADPSIKSVQNAKKIGEAQYQAYVRERLLTCKKSIYEVIPKNKLSLFRNKNAVKFSKEKLKVVSLQQDRKLYASLYVACQSRNGDLADFFAHENHAYPPAISEYGKLRKGNKADFLACLERHESSDVDEPTGVTAKIIDGAAMVQFSKPNQVKTFGEYSKEVFRKAVFREFSTNGMQRVDVVFDRYISGSLKSETREGRGSGIRILVNEATPIWKNWQKFLRNDENKKELFHLLAVDLTSESLTSCVVVATDSEEVLSSEATDLTFLTPCNHEEADTRIFLHVKHCADSGHSKVAIRTVDTDVVVIAISCFHSLKVEELWIEFGVGKSRRWLPVHSYVHALGQDVCKGLPFWYAFTGCDTVSSFSGKGKKIAWNTWKAFPEATDTFAR